MPRPGKKEGPGATVEQKNGSLAIRYRALSDLIPYVRNARTHSEEQVAQIAASIKEFADLSVEECLRITGLKPGELDDDVYCQQRGTR